MTHRWKDLKETRLKMLVVDDEPATAILLGVALQNDFRIVTETSGGNVLARALAEKPDVLLLDVFMPNISGFEVMSQLASHPVTAAIPVICMSTSGDAKVHSQILKHGGVGCVIKPLDMNALSGDIRNILQSTTKTSQSADGTRHVTVGFNESFKYRLLKQAISESLEAFRPTIVLSWMPGELFFAGNDEINEKLLKAVDEARLFYLQIKPALINRFPFINEMSPILADLQGLVGNVDPRECHLFVDEVSVLLNLANPEGALAKALLLNESFSESFCLTSYFTTRSLDRRADNVQNKLFRLLAA